MFINIHLKKILISCCLIATELLRIILIIFFFLKLGNIVFKQRSKALIHNFLMCSFEFLGKIYFCHTLCLLEHCCRYLLNGAPTFILIMLTLLFHLLNFSIQKVCAHQYAAKLRSLKLNIPKCLPKKEQSICATILSSTHDLVSILASVLLILGLYECRSRRHP